MITREYLLSYLCEKYKDIDKDLFWKSIKSSVCSQDIEDGYEVEFSIEVWGYKYKFIIWKGIALLPISYDKMFCTCESLEIDNDIYWMVLPKLIVSEVHYPDPIEEIYDNVSNRFNTRVIPIQIKTYLRYLKRYNDDYFLISLYVINKDLTVEKIILAKDRKEYTVTTIRSYTFRFLEKKEFLNTIKTLINNQSMYGLEVPDIIQLTAK